MKKEDASRVRELEIHVSAMVLRMAAIGLVCLLIGAFGGVIGLLALFSGFAICAFILWRLQGPAKELKRLFETCGLFKVPKGKQQAAKTAALKAAGITPPTMIDALPMVLRF